MKGPCAWCDADAVDSVAIKGSATSVHFCEDHRRVATEQASDSRAFDKPNVANKIFGKAASDRATREAA